MGQQQLLLLVLGISVVGVATVVGITKVSESSAKFTTEAITLEAANIASAILKWKMKPNPLGGGSMSTYLTGLTFDQLGIKSTSDNGLSAHTDAYWRTMRGLTTKRPYIVVRPKKNPELRIQLFIYGPSVDCFKVRAAQKLGNKWINDAVPVGRNNPPAGCTVWTN